jgi:capsular exopolysaccharide synthesis family protein
VRRRVLWIVLCVVVATGGAYEFSKRQAPKYSATASLLFNSNELNQTAAGLPVISSNNNSNGNSYLSTIVKLVQLGDVGAKTAKALGQSATVNVSQEGETSIVDVSATATSPGLAAAYANTYTRLFVKEQQNANRTNYASALALVNKQLAKLSRKERASPSGVTLQQRALSYEALAELPAGGVRVARVAAPPTTPFSPNTAKNTALGAVLGLLLGLGVAFLLEHFDSRIREPKDLEDIYHLPLLGAVPESAALARPGRGTRKRNAKTSLPRNEQEAFYLIRAHLRYFNVDRKLRTLLVTSAGPRDGKTTIARELASAAAAVGSVVLLIEANLRRPALAEQLDIQPSPGLVDVLIDAEPLWSATQPVDVDTPSVYDSVAGRTFDVLVAGAVLPPNPGELLESYEMAALLERAESTYDLVVIDTPPMVAVSDAFSLLSEVDGVIIVGRMGRNRRDIAERLHETLTGAGAPLLGVVANGVKAGRQRYAYPYVQTGATQPPVTPVSTNGGAADRTSADVAAADGAGGNDAAGNGAGAVFHGTDPTHGV